MKLHGVALLACALVAGCKGGGGDAPEPGADESTVEPRPESTTPKPEANNAAARAVDVELSRPPTGTGAPIPVRFTLPAGWMATRQKAWFVPADDPDMLSGVRITLDSTCSGSCAPADIDGNIGQVIASIKADGARPNRNTGNPELDAVRGTLEVVDERKLAHGTLLAYRITYSKEVLASGPYQQTVNVRCFVRRPNDSYYVALNGSAPIADEARRLPELVSACESASITEPEPAAGP